VPGSPLGVPGSPSKVPGSPLKVPGSPLGRCRVPPLGGAGFAWVPGSPLGGAGLGSPFRGRRAPPESAGFPPGVQRAGFPSGCRVLLWGCRVPPGGAGFPPWGGAGSFGGAGFPGSPLGGAGFPLGCQVYILNIKYIIYIL